MFVRHILFGIGVSHCNRFMIHHLFGFGANFFIEVQMLCQTLFLIILVVVGVQWLYDLHGTLLDSAEKGNLGVPQLPGQGCSFHSFRTNTYKLSFMESPSGMLSSQIWMWLSRDEVIWKSLIRKLVFPVTLIDVFNVMATWCCAYFRLEW